MINAFMSWYKANALITIPLTVGLVLLLALGAWYKGAQLSNAIGNWWYSRGTQSAHEDIDRLKGDAAAAKEVAAEALKELALEKERYKAEREKRELAEQLLLDRGKTTNEKLKLYEEAINKAPAISGPASVDDLCARARAAGIPCE